MENPHDDYEYCITTSIVPLSREGGRPRSERKKGTAVDKFRDSSPSLGQLYNSKYDDRYQDRTFSKDDHQVIGSASSSY